MQSPANEQSWQNPKIQKYFSTLSPFIQESIKQSGLDFRSVEDLKQFVQKLDLN